MTKNKLKKQYRDHTRKMTKADTVVNDFVQEFEQGATDPNACHLIGVPLQTFYRWMRKGEDYETSIDEDSTTEPDPKLVPYFEFRRAVLKAKACYQLGMTRYLNNYSVPGFDRKVGFLVLEVLSRRDRDHWAKEAPMDRSGSEQFSPDDQFM